VLWFLACPVDIPWLHGLLRLVPLDTLTIWKISLLALIALWCRPQVTIATAIVFCHRFFLRQSHAKNDRRVSPVENGYVLVDVFGTLLPICVLDINVTLLTMLHFLVAHTTNHIACYLYLIHICNMCAHYIMQTIATVCMFLAGKVEETPRPLKDVILLSYEIIHKKDSDAIQRIKNNKVSCLGIFFSMPQWCIFFSLVVILLEFFSQVNAMFFPDYCVTDWQSSLFLYFVSVQELYDQQKELILLGERVVLVTLGFDLNVHHPYKPLVEAIKRFKVAQNALAQVAWNFVNDGYAKITLIYK
jgi:hypothetical protein